MQRSGEVSPLGVGAMFGGRVDHQLDEKMRVRIPQVYLSGFPKGEPLYFVQYSPECVTIMSESVKDRRLGSFMDSVPSDEEFFDAMRVILSSVVPVEQDTQGRAKIPKYLREMAGLQKNVTTLGVGDFIEIWDTERWEEKCKQLPIRQANATYYARRKQASNE